MTSEQETRIRDAAAEAHKWRAEVARLESANSAIPEQALQNAQDLAVAQAKSAGAERALRAAIYLDVRA